MSETTAIRWRCGCKDADHCESPAKACQKVQRLEDEVASLREALRLHMAHFEWKCAADIEEVLTDSYDRWNYLVGLTERALGMEPQSRWRL